MAVGTPSPLGPPRGRTAGRSTSRSATRSPRPKTSDAPLPHRTEASLAEKVKILEELVEALNKKNMHEAKMAQTSREQLEA